MEEVIFQPGTTTVCINISILPDGILESNETLTAVLITSDPDVNLGLNTTTISIQNNDSK